VADDSQILHRRMVRIRARTENPDLKTQAEIEAADMTGTKIASMILYRPLVLFWEPILLVYNTYLALIYGEFSQLLLSATKVGDSWKDARSRLNEAKFEILRTALRLVRVIPTRVPGDPRFHSRRIGPCVSPPAHRSFRDPC